MCIIDIDMKNLWMHRSSVFYIAELVHSISNTVAIYQSSLAQLSRTWNSAKMTIETMLLGRISWVLEEFGRPTTPIV